MQVGCRSRITGIGIFPNQVAIFRREDRQAAAQMAAQAGVEKFIGQPTGRIFVDRSARIGAIGP